MKTFLFLIFIFCFSGCGFKSPPSPIFPTSKTQVDDEVKRRDVEQEKDKKEQEQEKDKQREKEKLNNTTGVTNATKNPPN